MGVLQELKGLLRGDSGPTAASEVSQANPLFVYIKIPGDIDPSDRVERFADPLQEALESAELGTVTGGGSQLCEPDSEGARSVEFCGIDVDLYHLGKGLELLRKELVRAGSAAWHHVPIRAERTGIRRACSTESPIARLAYRLAVACESFHRTKLAPNGTRFSRTGVGSR
jgi:hypothetical protein